MTSFKVVFFPFPCRLFWNQEHKLCCKTDECFLVVSFGVPENGMPLRRWKSIPLNRKFWCLKGVHLIADPRRYFFLNMHTISVQTCSMPKKNKTISSGLNDEALAEALTIKLNSWTPCRGPLNADFEITADYRACSSLLISPVYQETAFLIPQMLGLFWKCKCSVKPCSRRRSQSRNIYFWCVIELNINLLTLSKFCQCFVFNFLTWFRICSVAITLTGSPCNFAGNTCW